MRFDVVRLTSTAEKGIGNAGNAMLDIIYSMLIQQKGLDYYWHVKINQISDPQLEGFFVESRKVHVNVLFDTPENFHNLADVDQNKIRLEIIHQGMMKLSEIDKRFKPGLLEEIRNGILDRNFKFKIVQLDAINPVNPSIWAGLQIEPNSSFFDFYLVVKEHDQQKIGQLIFRGRPSDYYIDQLFAKCEWLNVHEFIITGAEKQMNIRFECKQSKLTLENLTTFAKPPLWEMMKYQSEADETAYQNWIRSLPPAFSAIIRDNKIKSSPKALSSSANCSDMNNNETEFPISELITFIRDTIREYNMPITRQTEIENDLGVTGDEAEDLIVAFGKRFNVDISNFDFSTYFYDEPGFFQINDQVIASFKVGDLEKAIIAGRLDESVINS